MIAVAIFGGIYTLLALGLNLQWGHTGLINFGHVAFFAIGAYTSALLTLAGTPLVVGVAAGGVLAALASYPLGRLTVRLREDYLAIVTIGFSEILRLILMNEDAWTGGPNGLIGVPRLFYGLGRDLRPVAQFLVVAVAVALVIYLFSRLSNSPYGRVLWSIREDERAAQSIGKDVTRYKIASLMIGSAAAGLAGGLYAHYIGYVVPDQFTPLVTFYVWTGIILGGSSHWGAALGTFTFVALMEGTRFLADFGLPIDDVRLAHVRFMIVGFGLILLMRFKPEGLAPHRYRERKERAAEHAVG